MATEEGMRLLRECHAMLTKLTAGAGGKVADDHDLDGQWGDEEIKKSPPRWKGEDFANRRMSETSPDFLDCLADFNDWKAERDDEKAATLTGEEAEKKRKYAGYSRKSAARARGWAARLRSGWKSPTAAANPDGWE